eukprot:654235_1
MALESELESSIWMKLQCGYDSCNHTWIVYGASYCGGTQIPHPGKHCNGTKKKYCKTYEKKIRTSKKWNVCIVSCSKQAHEILKQRYPTVAKSWTVAMSLNEPIDQDDQSDYNSYILSHVHKHALTDWNINIGNIRSTERERDPAALHPHVHDQRGDTTNIDVEMGNIADDIVTIMDLHESSESSPDLQNESSPDLNTIHPRQTRRT